LFLAHIDSVEPLRHARILVLAGEPFLRQLLERVLAHEGHQVTSATSTHDAWSHFEEGRPDLVVLDLASDEEQGLGFWHRLHDEWPNTAVVVMLAPGECRGAPTDLGRDQRLRQPASPEDVVAVVRSTLHTIALERRLAAVSLEIRRRRDSGFAYADPHSARTLGELQSIAASAASTVLVTGERGAGKSTIARLLHESGPRHDGPLVEIDCAETQGERFRDLLFGRERNPLPDGGRLELGLVELADGGTVFVDNVDQLSIDAQIAFLAFLEQRTFRRAGGTSPRRTDTRVVAAAGRPLRPLVAAGSFREDLCSHHESVRIEVPPLRERRLDVGPLAEQFLNEAGRLFGRRFARVGAGALGLLELYPWPKNVRELRAVMFRAAALHDDEVLRIFHLPPELLRTAVGASAYPVGALPLSWDEAAAIPSLEEVQMTHIQRVLDICRGNRTMAAQYLGITRQTVAKKVGGRPPLRAPVSSLRRHNGTRLGPE
jgi:two-component system response regulator AtoC